jgi:hypothetical protein
MKLSAFIIAIILASLFMVTFGLVMVDMNRQDPVPSFTNSTMAPFDKLQEVHNLSESIKTRIEDQSNDRTLLDVAGNIVLNGIDTLFIAASSFDIFFSMALSGLGFLHLPGEFTTAIMVIVVVVIFLGIIVAALIGRES